MSWNGLDALSQQAPAAAEPSWADSIREGLALTSEGLDVAAQARDAFSPPRPPQIDLPPPAPSDLAPAALTLGAPGILAVVRDSRGWAVMLGGRRLTLLQVAIGLGVAAALYRLMFARRGGSRRRRR
jgi:hypothetical protein